LTSVTVAESVNAALQASLTGIDVVNGAAAQVVLTPSSNTTAGTPFSLKVTVVDAFGNVVKNYTGTVDFTDSVATSGLPADYTFTAADAGAGRPPQCVTPASRRTRLLNSSTWSICLWVST